MCAVIGQSEFIICTRKNLDVYRLLFAWATFASILFSQDSGYIDISFVALESNKSLWIKDLQNHFLSVSRLAVCLRWQRFKEFLPKIYYSKWPVVIKPRWLFHYKRLRYVPSLWLIVLINLVLVWRHPTSFSLYQYIFSLWIIPFIDSRRRKLYHYRSTKLT